MSFVSLRSISMDYKFDYFFEEKQFYKKGTQNHFYDLCYLVTLSSATF